MSGTTPQATRRPIRSASVAVLGATAAGTAVWAVATTIGLDLTVRFGTGQPIHVTAVTVVLTAFLASLAGWGLLVVLHRYTANAGKIWTVTAAVAALLSLAGPLSTTATTGAKVSLMAMHLAVATVLIAALRRTTRP